MDFSSSSRGTSPTSIGAVWPQWNFYVASVGPWWPPIVILSHRYFIFWGIFRCHVDGIPWPAKNTSWITWCSSLGNIYQRLGPWTASMQLIAMIISIEVIDRWCRKPRRDDKASISMNCCPKMAHIHHKFALCADAKFINMEQWFAFAFFSSHGAIHKER